MTRYEAGLLPGDKVRKVEELLEQKEKNSVLAFVGDGINDAPVLMRADVGVAVLAILYAMRAGKLYECRDWGGKCRMQNAKL